VRWVTTKETHAQEIQDIVSAYFLTQRIKPAEGDMEADYLQSL
jgi:nickel superoxide dismutase